ncbi:MAG: hypothetical protein GY847_08375 [Proteobacteria bacterium]|nr:hypothetical protein [Pseudomonadota bacterium]
MNFKLDSFRRWLVPVLLIAFCSNSLARGETKNNSAAPPNKVPPKTKILKTKPSAEAVAPQIMVNEEYWSNKIRQTWGYALLASGMGVVITGTVLIEVDSWGTIGKAGFVSVGAGLGVSFVGMFLLGFSRPVHNLKPSRKISLAPTIPGRGATIAYEIYF